MPLTSVLLLGNTSLDQASCMKRVLGGLAASFVGDDDL